MNTYLLVHRHPPNDQDLRPEAGELDRREVPHPAGGPGNCTVLPFMLQFLVASWVRMRLIALFSSARMRPSPFVN